MNKTATRYGIHVDKIVFKELGNVHGCYYDNNATKEKIVTINPSHILDATSIRTLFHELRRAEQHQVLFNKNDKFSKNLKSAQSNYPSDTNEYMGQILYGANLLEYDANIFSLDLSQAVCKKTCLESHKASPDSESEDFVMDVSSEIFAPTILSLENNQYHMKDAVLVDELCDTLKDWKNNDMSLFQIFKRN